LKVFEDIALLLYQNLLGIKKRKKRRKKEEKLGKIIECIAIGLRHLSVRRPRK